MPLSLILADAGVTNVDYMSIDTEGNELECLLSLDWSATSVGLFFIEAGPASKDDAIHHLLSSRGYIQRPSVSFNLVYQYADQLHHNR